MFGPTHYTLSVDYTSKVHPTDSEGLQFTNNNTQKIITHASTLQHQLKASIDLQQLHHIRQNKGHHMTLHKCATSSIQSAPTSSFTHFRTLNTRTVTKHTPYLASLRISTHARMCECWSMHRDHYSAYNKSTLTNTVQSKHMPHQQQKLLH